MTNEKVRVRFAPSPTGLLHVGNARTALYNWLFARREEGVFILRVEDTDLERSQAQYEAQLIQDLHWLGLDWDEGPGGTARSGNVWEDERGAHGPYRQSERLDIYAKHTERLLKEGKAYPCFCTPEELEAERKAAAAEHRPQVYSGRCRYLTQAEVDENLAAGMAFAVRLKIEDHPLKFHDLVRGDVEFAAEAVSDPVLVRSAHGGASGMSEGVPVYNYVVTVDDALMEITHVIRGDDHISNTPRQVAIYQAFGWQVPEFAHLSTILGADRERLSKRHGATSISTFREMGYLPEALVNYLALLGWGAEDGKTETFTLEELTKAFSLERVTPSPAVFDFDKLNWLNRHYLKQADPARLAALAWPYFADRFGASGQAAVAPQSTPVLPPADKPELRATEVLPSQVMGTTVDGTGFREAGFAEGAALGSGAALTAAPGLSPYAPPSGEGAAAAPTGVPAGIASWFERLLALLVPKVDHLDQLPAIATPVFGVDPSQACANEENTEVLRAESAPLVLAQFANRVHAHAGPVTPEVFKAWMNEIKAATGVKGKELFHPVRIALIGFHSGPEFDKLIPLIEEGAALGLGIPTVRQRIDRFVGA
ncbi:MAG TPA: glutamate--tRNA ligase [Terracidiphilus sp.]|jgi:glutamyl-tRNA synthetase|nr:glutamate--tRNA ligase [Terracidiphilus sp.]